MRPGKNLKMAVRIMRMMMEVAYRLRVTLSLTMNISYNLTRTPIDLEARVSMLNADQRCVYNKITSHLLHLRSKSVHASS